MRSLSLLNVRPTKLVPTSGSATEVVQYTLDTASNNSYAITQRFSEDGTVDLAVFKLVKGDPAEEFPVPVIEWTSEPSLLDVPSQAKGVVSFQFLPELDSLVVVLANGDIEQIFSPDSDEPTRENVGTIEDGILAASWSPDEEILSVVTGTLQLVLLTKSFSPLSESPLHSSAFGTDEQVNVGWGDRATQFHGSLGKEAAAAQRAAHDNTLATADLASHADDLLPRIRWRGDAAYFAVTSVERARNEDGTERRRRRVRVFGRVGELSASSEPTVGLEGGLGWQPTGQLIASSQNLGEEGRQVVFFERNGLRRYEFKLRDPGAVRELGWNADSSLLAVWLEHEGKHVVQIWHRNNYHWYLKQQLEPGLASNATADLDLHSFLWHPEDALSIYLTTSNGVESYILSWDTFASNLPPPADDGAVAVVDGSTLLLTPFRLVQIPPPMSAVSLPTSLKGTPTHVAFSSTEPRLVALQSTGRLEVWRWDLVLSGMGRKEQARAGIPQPRLEWTSEWASGGYAVQAALVGEGEGAVVALLVCGEEGEEVLLAKEGEPLKRVGTCGKVRRMVAGKGRVLLEREDGELRQVSTTSNEPAVVEVEDLAPLPEFCPTLEHLELGEGVSTLIGLSASGRLYACAKLLASDATSFHSTPDFLLYTTFAHEVKFVPLASLFPGQNAYVSHAEGLPRPPAQSGAGGGSDLVELRRAVENGAVIVTVVPSSTNLVLQMPRGNLETVCPRPLVLRIVRQHLDQHRYRAAFLACRRHRIDLNVLYDHNPEAFEEHLGLFVQQVKEVDYLNLFLSGLKDEDVTQTMYKNMLPSEKGRTAVNAGKVNRVCDLVRAQLAGAGTDAFEYANTILTTHVRKQPQDYEAALSVLVQLKAQDPARAEDAVKYIIFLSDANKLFDLALGMYDFPLVLMVAQHSQKDPREYLPFLRELRVLEPFLQRFKIDDHLGRHESALRNLAQAGEGRFAEAVEYTKQHKLYAVALEAFEADAAKHKVILAANAEYLEGRKHYAEAGLLYSLAGQPAEAMAAYQSGLAWQELFTLALTERRSGSEIKAAAVAVADGLKGKRRFAEAGRVLLEYARDVEGAVGVLCEGAAFAEAVRLAALYNKRELVETHVKPALLEVGQRLQDECDEVEEQVEKQVERLNELEVKKEANPNSYFCIEELPEAMGNLSLQPDGASDAGTAFTRYTVAGAQTVTTQQTQSSSRTAKTAKSRRKQAVKKAAGRKGTIFEETYLLNSIKKAAEGKLVELQTEAAPLLPVLLSVRGSAQKAAAVAVQERIGELEAFLGRKVEEVWGWREKGWAREEEERQERVDRGEEVGPKVVWSEVEEGRRRVERPKVEKGKWRVGVLEKAE